MDQQWGSGWPILCFEKCAMLIGVFMTRITHQSNWEKTIGKWSIPEKSLVNGPLYFTCKVEFMKILVYEPVLCIPMLLCPFQRWPCPYKRQCTSIRAWTASNSKLITTFSTKKLWFWPLIFQFLGMNKSDDDILSELKTEQGWPIFSKYLYVKNVYDIFTSALMRI